MVRPNRDFINLVIARIISLRGTCTRASVGCVIAQDGRIVSTGYVGSPTGLAHCLDEGCEIVDGHCIRTSHAEQGAIAFAAKKGVKLEGATLYTTMSPCLSCAKAIINAGIKKVIFYHAYSDLSGITLLNKAGVVVDQYYGDLEKELIALL